MDIRSHLEIPITDPALLARAMEVLDLDPQAHGPLSETQWQQLRQEYSVQKITQAVIAQGGSVTRSRKADGTVSLSVTFLPKKPLTVGKESL